MDSKRASQASLKLRPKQPGKLYTRGVEPLDRCWSGSLQQLHLVLDRAIGAKPLKRQDAAQDSVSSLSLRITAERN